MVHRFAKANWTDTERIQRMIDSYKKRYDPKFWDSFIQLVGTDPRESIVDFGCGPGLFLIDAARKLNPKMVYGIDASKEMLQVASDFLSKGVVSGSFELKHVDFNREALPLEPESIDLAFSGFVFHEVADTLNHSAQVFSVLRNNGKIAIYDYVSGDKGAFIRLMMASGMSEESARKRYPHMCKNSRSDIETILRRSGFANVQSTMIDGARALVVGVKLVDPLAILGSSKTKRSDKKTSWIESGELQCPRCGSTRVLRVLDDWALSQGVQIFECKACGKRFYEKDVDDMRPTF